MQIGSKANTAYLFCLQTALQAAPPASAANALLQRQVLQAALHRPHHLPLWLQPTTLSFQASRLLSASLHVAILYQDSTNCLLLQSPSLLLCHHYQWQLFRHRSRTISRVLCLQKQKVPLNVPLPAGMTAVYRWKVQSVSPRQTAVLTIMPTVSPKF